MHIRNSKPRNRRYRRRLIYITQNFINPNDPDSIKITHRASVSNLTDVEHIIQRELQFSRLRVYLQLNIVIERQTVYEESIGDTVRIE